MPSAKSNWLKADSYSSAFASWGKIGTAFCHFQNLRKCLLGIRGKTTAGVILPLGEIWLLVLQPLVVLRWLCDSPRTGCAWRTTPYIYVAQTSNNRVIMACELYCCLLPQCEALRICRSEFPIATKWCCDQDVKSCGVQPSHKERAIGAVRCKKEWMLLQPLRWCCVDCVIHHERDVHEEQHHTYMRREQAILEWSRHVNSIVACCHSAKLCAYASSGFPITTLVTWPIQAIGFS